MAIASTTIQYQQLPKQKCALPRKPEVSVLGQKFGFDKAFLSKPDLPYTDLNHHHKRTD